MVGLPLLTVSKNINKYLYTQVGLPVCSQNFVMEGELFWEIGGLPEAKGSCLAIFMSRSAIFQQK